MPEKLENTAHNKHLKVGKADLNEVVEHEGGDAGTSPLWVGEDEGDVGLVVLHIRYHEGKGHHHFPDKNTGHHFSENNTVHHFPENTVHHFPDNTVHHFPDNTVHHFPEEKKKEKKELHHLPDNTPFS